MYEFDKEKDGETNKYDKNSTLKNYNKSDLTYYANHSFHKMS